MAIPKKLIGAGVLICTAVLLLFFLPSGSGRSMRLADGSSLNFEGIAIGTNHYYYDGRLTVALRHLLPSPFLKSRNVGPPPALDLVGLNNAGMAGLFQIRKDPMEMSFSWSGPEPKTFQETRGNRFIQLVDNGRSYISGGTFTQIGNEGGHFNVTFAGGTPLSDVLHLRLISGHEGKTNEWVVLGEMRVKNPVPKDKRF